MAVLSGKIKDILRRNGMQAEVVEGRDGKPKLMVMGHDSPVLTYNLTRKQYQSLTGDGALTYSDERAYNVIRNLIGDDFSGRDGKRMPLYVEASNTYGRVVTGLHGYRLGDEVDNYGRRGVPFFRPFSRHTRGWGGDFISWMPRHHEGWHHRRFGGFFFPGAPIVSERADGRLKPGELRSGNYGFFYKGKQRETSQDVLDDMKVSVAPKELQARPRPQGKAIPLSEGISSELYFTNEKFQEVMASHGVIIEDASTVQGKEHGKRIVIQSGPTKVDVSYDLTDEEYAKLTQQPANADWRKTVNDRLAIINKVIGVDFKDAITMDMLETKDLVGIDFKPEVKKELEAPFLEKERMLAEQRALDEARSQEMQKINAREQRIRRDPNAISGRDIALLMPGKDFYIEANGGRQMVVGEIRVDAPKDRHFINVNTDKGLLSFEVSKATYDAYMNNPYQRQEIISQISKEYQTTESKDIRIDGEIAKILSSDAHFVEGKNYTMSAMLNGEKVEHTISQKDYNKFLGLDDKHRLTFFADTFKEVEIRKADGRGSDDMYATVGQSYGQQRPVVGQFRDYVPEESVALAMLNNYSYGTEKLASITAEEAQQPHTVSNIRIHTAATLLGEKAVADTALRDTYVMTAIVDGQDMSVKLSKEQYELLRDIPKSEYLKALRENLKLGGFNLQEVSDKKTYVSAEQLAIEKARSSRTDGANLQDVNYKKAFYDQRGGKHAREVDVRDIAVDRLEGGKYKMTAVINGQSISHEISQSQFEKFSAVDDYQRMKLFAKVFPEVDMKTRPEFKTNVPAAILAAVVTVGEVAADIALGPPRPPRPEIYESRVMGPHFSKPGVHPAEVAAAVFETEMGIAENQRHGPGRGI